MSNSPPTIDNNALLVPTDQSGDLMVPSTQNGGLLPPTNQTGVMLAPVTVPQKLGTGSATGNPRNKCALKPGYSLMGWIRLGNSGEDLSGTGGRIRPVTSDELMMHNKRDDAWMAIRGKVYNVTRYMDYHPGGVDELLRGIGRDATKLFNEVHAWVNYQQLLAKCYIGPLRTAVKTDEGTLDSISESTIASPFGDKDATAAANVIVPRFDWTQKRTDVTLYIYTRQGCNPGLMLHRKNNTTLQLHVQLKLATHVYEFELHQSVVWPPKQLKVAAGGTGKIEITLAKTEAELWTAYGSHTVKQCAGSAKQLEAELQYDFKIVQHADFNHDSFWLTLQSCRHTIIWPPIGYHVSIATTLNGEQLQRSYTPIPAKYLPQPVDNMNSACCLNFLLKSYVSGQLSPHLRKLPIEAVLQVSASKGNFELASLLQHRRFAFLAAGSGLTPFLQLIEHLLQRNANRIEHLRLMYFNKTEADIWCREGLNLLQATDERFRCVHVLSQANSEWLGLTGRISGKLLAHLVDETAAEHATFIAVCGPGPFNQLATTLLNELQFKTENLHMFQG